jgi:hypothetical protein
VEPARREWFLDGTERSRETPGKKAARGRIVAPAAGSVLAEDPDIPPARQRVAFESLGASGAFWRSMVASAGRWMSPSCGYRGLAVISSRSWTSRRNELDRVEFTVRSGGR